MKTIETKAASRVVISTNQNTAGQWESRLYVNHGAIATPTSANHKTEAGAIRWAKKVLAR
jgi:hypothetical protein